nr:MAG TPA: hypothetical protein [Caudoviricetes sp.]
MQTITVYIKKYGFNIYYKIEYNIYVSRRGYKIAVPAAQEEISKYRYYKDTNIPHYTVYDKYTIHEIGNKKFFDKIFC